MKKKESWVIWVFTTIYSLPKTSEQIITLFSAETEERERHNYRTIAIFQDRTPVHSYLWTEVAPSTGFVFFFVGSLPVHSEYTYYYRIWSHCTACTSNLQVRLRKVWKEVASAYWSKSRRIGK